MACYVNTISSRQQQIATPDIKTGDALVRVKLLKTFMRQRVCG